MGHPLAPLNRIKIGVIQFPGSNCDTDCVNALTNYFQVEAIPVWFEETNFPKLDGVVIPGGFSFGDYLRSGALAARAPMMSQLKNFAHRGGPILGICNGFQILVESEILPGALLHNNSLNFTCKYVQISDSNHQKYAIPIAHGEGRYWIDDCGLKALKDHNSIAFKYCDTQGLYTLESNPNGSIENIAGIYSKNKKVLGLMPHPERATSKLTGGSNDGLKILKAFLDQT